VSLTTEVNGEKVVAGRQDSRRASWKKSARSVVTCYLFLFAFGSLLGGLMPWIGRWWFVFELGSHFQHVYVLMAAAATAAFLLFKRWKVLPVAVAGLLITGWHIVPCYIGVGSAQSDGTRVRLMTVNVLTVNTNHEGFAAVLAKEQPDVVALQELNQVWVDALREMADVYPHQVFDPRSDNFGIGLMSRYPWESVEFVDLFGVNAIRAEVLVDGKRLTVLNVHTLPPASPSYAAIRNQQLDRIAGLVQNVESPLVVLGDLNATMWSPYFRDLLERTHLLDARRGYGIVSTWPDDLTPLTIPIDHCLYTPPLAVQDFRSGPRFRSDHLPLTIDFILPAGSGEARTGAAA
jgi:endonuclease/exonuclease/phosphatase (EEP) superfamily protein YafD